jgi:hypothetical protein
LQLNQRKTITTNTKESSRKELGEVKKKKKKKRKMVDATLRERKDNDRQNFFM